MQHSTNKKQGELLNTQLNVEGTPNSPSGKLIEREQMKDTPFWIIGTEENGYFGTLGKYQITEKFPTKQAVENHVETKVWEIIMKVAGIVANDMIEANERIKANRQPINKI